MSKVYTITNQKGGAGKTTTALAVAAGLSLKGYSVLFHSLDAQSNMYIHGGSQSGRSYSFRSAYGGDQSRGRYTEDGERGHYSSQ